MVAIGKRPLWLYVVGVIVTIAIVNYVSWSIGGAARFGTSELVSLGFLLGMLAMYIAVHLYKWK